MAGFFEPSQVTYSPSLEPQGFDLLRQFLMSQIFQRGANPYGLSPEGMSNMGNKPIVSNQPDMSRLSGFGYSPQNGGGMPPPGPSPGQGQPSRQPRTVTRYDGRRPNDRGRERPSGAASGPVRKPYANVGSGAFFGGPKPPQFPSMPGMNGPGRIAPIKTQPGMPQNPISRVGGGLPGNGGQPIEPPGFGGMQPQPGRPGPTESGKPFLDPGREAGAGPGRYTGPSFGQPPPVVDRMQNPLASHMNRLMTPQRQPSFQGRGF